MCVLARWHKFFTVRQEIETKTLTQQNCGKLHCPLMVSRKNKNSMNGLDARAQNIDEVQLRKRLYKSIIN